MFTSSHQYLYPVLEHQKTELLLHLLAINSDLQQLGVFVRTRDEAHRLVAEINKAIGTQVAEAVLLNTKESFLKEILSDFKSGAVRILVTMDAAARSIELAGMQNVINFDFPETIDDYLSRINKGELASSGICLTLFTTKSNTPLQKLESTLGYAIQRETAEQFIYDTKPPATNRGSKSPKSKSGKTGKPNKKNKRK